MTIVTDIDVAVVTKTHDRYITIKAHKCCKMLYGGEGVYQQRSD